MLTEEMRWKDQNTSIANRHYEELDNYNEALGRLVMRSSQKSFKLFKARERLSSTKDGSVEERLTTLYRNLTGNCAFDVVPTDAEDVYTVRHRDWRRAVYLFDIKSDFSAQRYNNVEYWVPSLGTYKREIDTTCVGSGRVVGEPNKDVAKWCMVSIGS